MSLAAKIARQLNGRKSGNGWVIPAICHNPDSAKHNLQISDGKNGKLSAYCHSNACNYQTIMEAFELYGYKQKDVFNREQVKTFKLKKSRIELIKLLEHEIFVLSNFNNARLNSLARAADKNYMKIHPEFKTMPAEAWEREQQAIERIHQLTGELK